MSGNGNARNGWSRRQFVRNAAIAGGAAGVGGAPFLSNLAKAAATPFGQNLTGLTGGPIDHVIVLMMENRSFDHHFGWKTGTNDLQYADRSGPQFYDGATLRTHHLGGTAGDTPHYHKPDFRGCHHPDPAHGWDTGRSQMVNGFLDGRNDAFAIGYYLPQDIEFYAKLAANFTLCDNYYCSLMASTFPNREYQHSAQSGGIADNGLPARDYPQHPTGFSWTTIWDLLEAAGVPWGYYFVDLPATGLWGPRLIKGTHHLEHFFEDVHNGRLPNVTFVDPGFTTGLRTDEHPYSDIRAAQAFVHNIVKATIESPLWQRTALFINYDEWGGFFDHIQTPPVASDERSGKRADAQKQLVDVPAGETGFEQLGFRVPCTIVSPYARRNRLSSSILAELSGDPEAAFNSPPQYDDFIRDNFYDHASILKYIENLFLKGAHLTDRDRDANDIGLLLDTESPANLDGAEILDTLPRIPVTSPPCEDDELEGAFVDGSLKGTGLYRPDVAYDTVREVARLREEQINTAFNTKYDDDFQDTLESGVFEKFGYKIEQEKWRYLLGG